MRPKAGYLAVESAPPLRGLGTSFPSNKIDPAFSPRLLNVVIRDGVVRRRAGGDQLGRTLVGRVLAILEFGEIGQVPYTVALTAFRQYAYDPSAQDWLDITPGQVSYAITAVDQTDDWFKIAGDHVADFPIGRLIPVIGGANEGIYTVNAIALDGGNTKITVEEEIPSAIVAGIIVIADDLATGDEDFIDYVAVTDINGRRLILTNGVDTPRQWDGNLASIVEDWVPNFDEFVTCKTLCVFAEHLFLGNVTTAEEEPQLIAWSAAGDMDEFEDGDAGAQLLYQLVDSIMAMRVLGDRIAIYSRDTAMNGVFVGLPAVFAFEVVIPDGVRLVSGKAITSINVGHVFVSEENFYIYDGSRGLRTLGDPIYTDYKAAKDHQFLFRTCLLNDFSKRTIFFAIPDIEEGSLIYTARYDVFDLAKIEWSKEKYLDTVTCWGFFVNHDEQLLWEDASWEQPSLIWTFELGSWGEEGEQLRFPIRAYGTDDGRVMITTEGGLGDHHTGTTNVAPTQLYETKDFEVPEAGESVLGRWGEIEFEAWGTQVNVITSKDMGQNYVGVETVVLEEVPRTYRLPIDITSKTLRVKFISSGNVFSLSWVRLWVRPGGPE